MRRTVTQPSGASCSRRNSAKPSLATIPHPPALRRSHTCDSARTGKSPISLSTALCKNIPLLHQPKSSLELFVSRPAQKGVSRCRGRGSVGRATGVRTNDADPPSPKLRRTGARPTRSCPNLCSDSRDGIFRTYANGRRNPGRRYSREKGRFYGVTAGGWILMDVGMYPEKEVCQYIN